MNCNAAPIAVGVTVQLRTNKGGNGNETFSFIGIVHPVCIFGSSIRRRYEAGNHQDRFRLYGLLQ